MANAKKKEAPQSAEPAAEDFLIREVDDEMRAERLQSWWQRFGSMLVGACVTVILATVVYQLASSYRTSQAEERTSILLQAQEALDKGQTETALNTLAELAEEDSAAAMIAQLQTAKLEHEQSTGSGDYQTIIQQDDYPAIRDMAAIQAEKLEAIDASSPFYPLAAEQKAIQLLQADQKEEARSLILTLLDRKDLPSSQRLRLNELLQGVH